MTEYYEFLVLKSAQEQICVFPLDPLQKKKSLKTNFAACS